MRTVFISVGAIAHVPQWFFGMPNLYLVCRLTPQSYTVGTDDEDILDTRWLPLATFLNDPTVSDFNKGMVHAALGHGGLRLESPEQLLSPVFEGFTVL